MHVNVIRLGLAVLLLAGTPGAARAESSCSDFANAYLRSGLPSGSRVDVALELFDLDGVLYGEQVTTLTLDYPRYPAVAGKLIGAGVALQVRDGALELEMKSGEQRVTLRPVACNGSSLLVASDLGTL